MVSFIEQHSVSVGMYTDIPRGWRTPAAAKMDRDPLFVPQAASAEGEAASKGSFNMVASCASAGVQMTVDNAAACIVTRKSTISSVSDVGM